MKLWLAGSLLAMAASPLFAERYALLVGVGKYKNGIHGLEGVAFDVPAVRDLLIRNGYAANAITVVMDEQATRPHIVDALRQQVARLKSGDRLLFYYSGHGTSAFDKNLQFLSSEIGPDSGGLATYDLSLESAQAAAESLVIGRRDLKPILSQVPAGAQALVVLDACYSENSAKNVSILTSAPVRGINLVDVLPAAGPGAPAGNAPNGGADGGAYPYQNVISLSAASKDQTAVDINIETMKQNPDWTTVDRKPHGALTNAFLEALGGQGDTNHDGTVSYDEMFRYIRREMEKYPHQPQLLSAKGFALDQPVFGATQKPVAPQPAPTPPPVSAKIRVHFPEPAPELQERLRAVPEVEVVDAGAVYDILVRRNQAEWGIYDSGGILIQSLPADQIDATVLRIRVQGQLSQLRLWTNPQQTFNVRIDAEPTKAVGYDQFRAVFHVGEQVRFRISTEQQAFLLLLDIDKNGRVTVLFPGPPQAERALQQPGKPVEFVTAVTRPAGSDELKLIAFPRQPQGWADWACAEKSCPEFSANDPKMTRLMQLLRSTPDASETSLRVITQE